MKVPGLAAITALAAAHGMSIKAMKNDGVREFTEFDQQRIDKAVAKRERKANALRERGRL